jgi:hypothetical protein
MSSSSSLLAARVRKDSRGAIMIGAVFMAAFMVGALWYVIGIGDAIVYRESMQDAADATAFAASVYHARGMNVIALLNVTAAAVFALLVAAKVAQYLLLAANVASCVAGEPGTDDCTKLGEQETPYKEFMTRVDRGVTAAVHTLTTTQTAIATGMPRLAQTRAKDVPTQFGGAVTSGYATSTALAAAGGGGGGGGGAAGLPVQDDDFTPFCRHAAEGTADLTMRVFTGFYDGAADIQGDIQERAGNLLEGVAKKLPDYFCGDANGGAPKDLTGANGDPIDDVVNGGDRTIEEVCNEQPARPPSIREACKKGLQDGLAAANDRGSIGAQVLGKRIATGAKIGDAHFAAWGVVSGQFTSTGEGGVKLATWNQPTSEQAAEKDGETLAKIGVAESEVYYEPRQNGPRTWVAQNGANPVQNPAVQNDPNAPAAGGVKDEALYNMRWRARLRRVHLPNAATLAAGATGAAQNRESLDKLVQHATNGGGAAPTDADHGEFFH